MNDILSTLLTFGFIVAAFFILFAFEANQDIAMMTTAFLA